MFYFIFRQIANALYPLQKLRQTEEGVIHLDTVTTFKSSYTQFKIGEPWEEYTLDKRYTTTTPTLDGNKLIKDQVGGFYLSKSWTNI